MPVYQRVGNRVLTGVQQSSHSTVLRMCEGRGSLRVLELGCSTGALAKRLRERGHHVTGIDVVQLPGVTERVDAFVRHDLSSGVPDLGESRFDLVIAADVLEHLSNPGQLLRQVHGVLAPGAGVVVSIPNFGHWYSRARVGLGAFGYDRRGTLDDTHLRFFTRRMVRRLAARSGFDIREEQYTGLPLEILQSSTLRVPRWLRRVDGTLVAARPQLFAYQFVLSLTPHSLGYETHVFGADREAAQPSLRRTLAR